jgi:hypothetical protein
LNFPLFLTYPFLCYYNPEDNIGEHYFIWLPIGEEILSIVITSKVEKRKAYNKRMGLGKIVEVDNTIKGFEDLTLPSAVDVPNQRIITEQDYNRLVIKKCSSSLDEDFIVLLATAVCESGATKPNIAERVRKRYLLSS